MQIHEWRNWERAAQFHFRENLSQIFGTVSLQFRVKGSFHSEPSSNMTRLMGESSMLQILKCNNPILHEDQNINLTWSTTEFKGASLACFKYFLSETVTFAVWKITWVLGNNEHGRNRYLLIPMLSFMILYYLNRSNILCSMKLCKFTHHAL